MRNSNFRVTKVIQVIETQCLEGEGTNENTYRIVTYYHDLEGRLLAVSDPQKEAKEAE